MIDQTYDIAHDPEANVLFEKCSQVDPALWDALKAADPREVEARTGVAREQRVYRLPFLNSILVIQPDRRQSHLQGREGEDPSFQLCLTALLYLLKVDRAAMDPRPASPKEFRGGVTFFQGPHALPVSRLASDLRGFDGGSLHLRLRVQAKPTDAPVHYQVCLVPEDIHVSPACTAAGRLVVTGPGTVSLDVPLASLSGIEALDWRRGVQQLMLVLRQPDGTPIDDRALPGQTARALVDAERYYPMTVHLSAALVPPGAAFPGWP